MCVEIQLGEQYIEDQGQLAAAIGQENVVYQKSSERVEPDHCLCPVDLDATAAKIGRRVEQDESYMFVYFKEA